MPSRPSRRPTRPRPSPALARNMAATPASARRVSRALAVATALTLAATGCVTQPSPGTDLAQKHNRAGAALLKAERFEEAETEFGLAAELDPEYALARTNLAYTEHKLGHDDLAIEALKALNDRY